MALAQRDFLIKSYGMLEQIYVAMRRNGMLRPADERKYGLYGRLGLHANTNHDTCSSSHKPHHRQNDHLNATQPAADTQCPRCSLRRNEVTTFSSNRDAAHLRKSNPDTNQILLDKFSRFYKFLRLKRHTLFFHFLGTFKGKEERMHLIINTR